MVEHRHLANDYSCMRDKVVLLNQDELKPTHHLPPKPLYVLYFLYEDVLLMCAKVFQNYITSLFMDFTY